MSALPARFPSLLLALLLLPAAMQAQAGPHALPLGLTASLEYLAPTKNDRRIGTVTADVRVEHAAVPGLGLRLGIGLTATGADGHIFQLDPTLTRVRFDNRALGLGPTAYLGVTPVRLGRLRLGMEATAGLLLYSTRFPAGGDHYNGMLRVGPVLALRLSPTDELRLSAKWMHVSNGQGLGPHNPSYEGHGLALGWSRGLTHTVSDRAAARRRSVTGGVIGGLAGAAGALLLSRHCEAGSCRIGGGITAVGGATGLGLGLLLGRVLGD